MGVALSHLKDRTIAVFGLARSGLATVQAAHPCAQWDESLGKVWLTSDQFVASIFASLQR